MFSKLARLGVTRAAAFFYAVAVGVAANIVIAHFSPHDGPAPSASPAPAETHPGVAKAGFSPVATALIAPKPAEPTKPIEVSTPATTPAPLPALPITAPATSGAATPAGSGAGAAALPAATSMTPLPPKSAVVPSAPAASDGKPAPDKPASDIEAASGQSSAAPVSLLPPPEQPAAEQPASDPPPALKKPGPGSGGLY